MNSNAPVIVNAPKTMTEKENSVMTVTMEPTSQANWIWMGNKSMSTMKSRRVGDNGNLEMWNMPQVDGRKSAAVVQKHGT